jgi:hypothetical protein
VSSLDWVAATAAAPLSVVAAALSADHVGIRPTYVVAGAAAAVASLAGLVLLRRTGEPTSAADAEPGTAAPGQRQKRRVSALSRPRRAS